MITFSEFGRLDIFYSSFISSYIRDSAAFSELLSFRGVNERLYQHPFFATFPLPFNRLK